MEVLRTQSSLVFTHLVRFGRKRPPQVQLRGVLDPLADPEGGRVGDVHVLLRLVGQRRRLSLVHRQHRGQVPGLGLEVEEPVRHPGLLAGPDQAGVQLPKGAGLATDQLGAGVVSEGLHLRLVHEPVEEGHEGLEVELLQLEGTQSVVGIPQMVEPASMYKKDTS